MKKGCVDLYIVLGLANVSIFYGINKKKGFFFCPPFVICKKEYKKIQSRFVSKLKIGEYSGFFKIKKE